MWLIFDENIVLLIVASQKTINNQPLRKGFLIEKKSELGYLIHNL